MAEKGYVTGRDRGRGLLGWGRWARLYLWLGSAHLDIFFGPQLIGLHLLLGNRSCTFHNYSGAL